MKNAPEVFNFESGLEVRVTTDEKGMPWFVAKDVAMALEYSEGSNPSRLIDHIPTEWKGVKPIHTTGGTQRKRPWESSSSTHG